MVGQDAVGWRGGGVSILGERGVGEATAFHERGGRGLQPNTEGDVTLLKLDWLACGELLII